MPLNQITRSGAEALIPQQISDQIIQELPTRSTFLALARQMPRMTSKQTKIPVLTGLAQAGFVTGDTGRKPTTALTWDNVYITAEELAVIVPIPEAVLDDSNYDIWGEVRPRIVEAFGKAIDEAAFFGINKPSSWPAGIVPAAIAAGNVVTHLPASGNLYKEINGEEGVLAAVENSGIGINGYVGALQLRSKLRSTMDLNGQPLFRTAYSNGANGRMVYDLNGDPINFPDNGCWDPNMALLLAGNFDYARYAIRQDITFRIFDQGTLTDGSGNVTLSLMENDCVALRAVMRLGWALPKPVNPISGMNYYPFSVLQTTNATEIGAVNCKLTAPVTGAAPVTAHDEGHGYTAAVTWFPTGSTFAAETIYTATVTYTAKDGYVFAADIDAKEIIGIPDDAIAVAIKRVSDTVVTAAVTFKATGAAT